MTRDAFFLRFLWGPREEQLDQCALRLNRFLLELNSIDPAFSVWQHGDTNSKHFFVPVAHEQSRRWLCEGVNRKDVGKEVIPELGFSTSLICNANEAALTLRVNCGGYSPWNKNSCVMEFPSEGKTFDRLIEVSNLTRIAKAVIKNWQPDHGIITSHQCSTLTHPKSFLTEAGWITYLSEKYNHIVHFPGQLRTEKVGDGRILIITSDRFATTNADHINSVSSICAVLDLARPRPVAQ